MTSYKIVNYTLLYTLPMQEIQPRPNILNYNRSISFIHFKKIQPIQQSKQERLPKSNAMLEFHLVPELVEEVGCLERHVLFRSHFQVFHIE
jgi:hypothetical protein